MPRSACSERPRPAAPAARSSPSGLLALPSPQVLGERARDPGAEARAGVSAGAPEEFCRIERQLHLAVDDDEEPAVVARAHQRRPVLTVLAEPHGALDHDLEGMALAID